MKKPAAASSRIDNAYKRSSLSVPDAESDDSHVDAQDTTMDITTDPENVLLYGSYEGPDGIQMGIFHRARRVTENVDSLLMDSRYSKEVVDMMSVPQRRRAIFEELQRALGLQDVSEIAEFISTRLAESVMLFRELRELLTSKFFDDLADSPEGDVFAPKEFLANKITDTGIILGLRRDKKIFQRFPMPSTTVHTNGVTYDNREHGRFIQAISRAQKWNHRCPLLQLDFKDDCAVLTEEYVTSRGGVRLVATYKAKHENSSELVLDSVHCEEIDQDFAMPGEDGAAEPVKYAVSPEIFKNLPMEIENTEALLALYKERLHSWMREGASAPGVIIAASDEPERQRAYL